MSLPTTAVAKKLSPPVRLLYRGLRRLGSHYDKYALLKAFYIDNESRYVPTKSFEIEIRKAFRESANLNESKFNETLTEGFSSYRYLNALLEEFEVQKPWYRQVTNQFLESKLARDNLNFKTHLPCISTDVKPGSILISHPYCRNSDSYSQTVILILRHDKTGTTGLLLDKDFPTDGIVKDPIMTYWTGGPVSTDNNLIVLHTNAIQSSKQISTHLFYSYVNKKQIHSFVKGIDVSHYRIFNTSSEWSPGQLYMELSTGYWFLASCPDDILFESKGGGGALDMTETIPQQPLLPESHQGNTTSDVVASTLPSETGTASLTTTPITTTTCVVDLSDTTKNKFGYSLWKKVLRLLGGEYAAFSFIDGITDNVVTEE